MTVTIYLVRHGEVEHHETDVSLTARGRDQARAAGVTLAGRVADGDAVHVHHSPVTRVRETAELLLGELTAALVADGRAPWVELHPLQPDEGLQNVRFMLGPGQEPIEPSVVYSQTADPAHQQRFSPAQAEFYRGFWADPDTMGYWLTHDSGGWAESPETVLARVCELVAGILNGPAQGPGRSHWVLVTHSAPLRALLRHAMGEDLGEPEFCGVALIGLSGVAGSACLTYRNRTVPLDLANCP